MISPTEAILVQPEHFEQKRAGPDAPFVPQLADLVGRRIGIPTTMLTDDELFDAALVGLGSCGIVLSVVIDAAPLYLFDAEIRAFDAANAKVLDTIHTLDATKLGLGADPYHLAFVAVPYARAGQDGFYVTALHHRDAAGKPFDRALDRTSMASSCLSNFLGVLIPLIAAGPLNQVVSSVIQTLVAKNYGPRDIVGLFPGQTFGPTGLPRGHGTARSSSSTIDTRGPRWRSCSARSATRASPATSSWARWADRFVPATRVLLGMSHHPMNCFIELPTPRRWTVVQGERDAVARRQGAQVVRVVDLEASRLALSSDSLPTSRP